METTKKLCCVSSMQLVEFGLSDSVVETVQNMIDYVSGPKYDKALKRIAWKCLIDKYFGKPNFNLLDCGYKRNDFEEGGKFAHMDKEKLKKLQNLF